MEEDREYNACKALDPQIDNEDDVHHSSPDYEINEQEIQKQMWLGGLHGCNEWAGQIERSGFSSGFIWIGRTGRNIRLGGLGRTRRTVERTGREGTDGADEANWRTGRTRWNTKYWTGRTRANGADWRIGADGPDWAEKGKRGRLGGLGGGGRMEWTGKPGADIPTDWADRLEYGRPG